MIDITVIRGAANVEGEVISNPLLETITLAMERGRNEIDANTEIIPTTLTSVYRAGLDTGQVIEVLDALQGSVWRGKIRGVTLAMEGVSATAMLRVERL